MTPRGLVVTSDGATVQVLNGLVLVTPAGVTFNAGTWTDLNPGYGDGNTNTVNEFDFFVGANVNITPKLEAGVSYVQFISGQNAFFDERNIEFTLKYHDGKKARPSPSILMPSCSGLSTASPRPCCSARKAGRSMSNWGPSRPIPHPA
ncbi:hypothetical protein ACFSTD_02625 [Novosphingobium colocasiae]